MLLTRDPRYGHWAYDAQLHMFFGLVFGEQALRGSVSHQLIPIGWQDLQIVQYAKLPTQWKNYKYNDSCSL